jgi:hypothetical protein
MRLVEGLSLARVEAATATLRALRKRLEEGSGDV